jgi:hypothetical protein
MEAFEKYYGDDLIISEWFVDYTHAEWGKVTHDQVSVQQWKGRSGTFLLGLDPTLTLP